MVDVISPQKKALLSLNRLNRWLITPLVPIDSFEDRLKSEWLATILLLLLPTSLLLGNLPFLLSNPLQSLSQRPSVLVSLVFMMCFAVMYLLGRLGLYKFVSVCGVAIGFLAIWITILTSDTDSRAFDASLLLLPLLFAGSMFTPKRALLISLIAILSIFAFPLLIPGLTFETMLSLPFNIVLVGACLSLFGISLKDRLEQHQTDMLRAANNSLQLEITERKRAEQALRDSEAKFRAIFDTAPYILSIMRLDGTFAAINPAGLQQIGASEEAIIGHTPVEIGWIRDPNWFRQLVEQMKINGKIDSEEMTVLDWTGKAVDMLTSNRYISLDGKQHILTIATDITTRKQTEQQAIQITIERQRAQLLKTFIDDISHDLMTPLSVIRTSAYLSDQMLSGLPGKMALFQLPESSVNLISELETVRARCGKIQENTVRLENLIRRLIEMVEVDDQTSYNLTSCDLNQSIANVIEGQETGAAMNGLTLRFLPDETLPWLQIDKNAFPRVIENLINNALVFTPRGGTITVRTFQDADKAVVEVNDTGIGIPEAALSHIFERFYRVDTTRQTNSGGSGLGLTIAHKIVVAHDGEIKVESTPGLGSTFRVLLPIGSTD